MYPGRRRFPVWAPLCALVLMLATAVSAAPPAVPGFKLPADPNTPVIEYGLHHHMLAEQDPAPLLRIYADGRVHVHRPLYMKQAGDYEFKLSPLELTGLIRSLALDGVIDFDRTRVEDRKQASEAQRRAAGQYFEISDTTETVITLRLAEYRQPGTAVPVQGLARQVRWPNLDNDSRRYPDLPEIQGLATASARLHALLDDTRLRPVPAPPGAAN